jgi:hypothetical protein
LFYLLDSYRQVRLRLNLMSLSFSNVKVKKKNGNLGSITFYSKAPCEILRMDFGI